jgi:hypothetical protein
MFLDVAIVFVCFWTILLGLGMPMAARLALPPRETLLAAILCALLAVFFGAWAVFVLALPSGVLLALPVLAALGLLFRGNSFAAFRDPEVRAICASQLLVSAWVVGWLSLIKSYSGGGWAADWFEHWDRARFFGERWPRDFQFLGHPLPARPPLANVVVAFFLQFTRADFPTYQVVSTLLSSLVFLPAEALASRWGSAKRTTWILGLLLMLNPLFVQNATFPWTKLPAAFFVLTAVYFFLRFRDENPAIRDAVLCSAALGAGLITHYSAGPYAVVIAMGWFFLGGSAFRNRSWRRATAWAAAVGVLVCASWFAWSLSNYGTDVTLLSNSSVTAARVETATPAVKALANLRDTIVPHFLRDVDQTLIQQKSPWGRVRDWFFQLYQLNLFFAFGSLGWLGILVALRARGTPRSRASLCWLGSIILVVVLGVVVHGARDVWGLTHICLQPLVLAGLAFLAARWADLGRMWQRIVLVGGAFDLGWGIFLHFSLQNQSPLFWRSDPIAVALSEYSGPAAMNLAAKLQHGLTFLGDLRHPPATLMLAVLGGILTLAIVQFRSATRAPH